MVTLPTPDTAFWDWLWLSSAAICRFQKCESEAKDNCIYDLLLWILVVFVYFVSYTEFASLWDMGDPEQKAMELVAQAEKKMKSSGGFFGNLMGYGLVVYGHMGE